MWCLFKLGMVLALALFVEPGLAEPAQVLLFRHAEKPDDPNALHLSAQGRERAKALVKFFTTNKKVNRYGPPVALYATRTTRRGRGQRPRETLEPLAKQLHLSIQTPCESEDYDKLARDIRKNPKYNDKTVVICWVHEYLPEFARELGVNPQPPKWKDSVYDKVYLINYTGGKATLDTINQKLLPGDSKYKDPSDDTN